MRFHELEPEYAGYPIRPYVPGAGLTNPAGEIPHLSWAVEWDADEFDEEPGILDQFTRLLQEPDCDQIPGLSIGYWEADAQDASTEILEALIAAAPQFPNLKVLFIGHILRNETEISWILMDDLSPLWEAFPQLEYLRIRGAIDLTLGQIEHAFLKELKIESGGLPVNVLNEIARAKLPALEHLELFLGSHWHGWDGQPEDVLPLLAPELFPRLKYLGLRDSDVADEIAELVGANPAILEKVDVLDLSLGTLSARGGQALLGCEGVRSLQKLDLHHHYLPEPVRRQLQQLPIAVDLSDPQGEHLGCYTDEERKNDDRYVAVNE